MKNTFLLAILAVCSLGLGGCGTPAMNFTAAATHFPPLQPENARVFIYCVDPIMAQYAVKTSIDGKKNPPLWLNSFVFQDHPAGSCEIDVSSSNLLFPQRASTIVTLIGGQTEYIQIQKDTGLFPKTLVIPTDPDQALPLLDQCVYAGKDLANVPKP